MSIHASDARFFGLDRAVARQIYDELLMGTTAVASAMRAHREAGDRAAGVGQPMGTGVFPDIAELLRHRRGR